MSPLRRALTILVLACAMVLAQAPRNDANAFFVPLILAVPKVAGWIGTIAATAAAVDVATGSNFAGRGAQLVAQGGAMIATAVGATETAATLQTAGQVANTGLQFVTRTAGAFVGARPPPDPADVAARAIAFANDGVLLAPFVRQFVETASQVGQQFGIRIAAEVLTLLNYVFLIWLLLQVAQMMLGMARGSEIFWNIVKRGAVYMILVAMLVGVQSGEYWRWFVQEPLQATSSMTQALAGEAGGRSVANCGAGAPGDAATSAESIVCVTERVLRGGIATGWTLIAATPFRLSQPLDMPRGLANILGGVGLCIFFGLALIYFGFFVIDVFLRVLVLAMFSPIFIALYLIETTRSVPRNAINNLIGSLFTLLGAVAVLSIVGGLIGNLVGGGPGASWDALIRQYAQDAVNLSPNVGIGDSRYWTLAFAALTLIGSAKAIGGLMGGIFGGAAAGTAADKATSIAAIPLKAAATGATLGAGGAAMAAGRLAVSALPAAGRGAMAFGRGAVAAGNFIAGGAASMARRKMGWGP
jgi:hypothetical protein